MEGHHITTLDSIKLKGYSCCFVTNHQEIYILSSYTKYDKDYGCYFLTSTSREGCAFYHEWRVNIN